MYRVRCLVVGFFTLASMGDSFANDTATTASAGGIVFTKNDHVEMRSELLKISLDQIEVNYEFFNKSAEDLELDIAFPLPPVHWRDGYASARDPLFDVYQFLGQVSGQDSNFNTNTVGAGKGHLSLDFAPFQVKVEGKSLRYQLKYRAISSEGMDITKTLYDNNIPLSIMFVNGWVGDPALESIPALKPQLQALNLLNSSGQATWHNEASYHWRDKFPARKPHSTSHAYSPEAGSQWVELPETVKTIDDVKIGNWKLKDYCPSDDVAKKVMSRKSVRDKNNISSVAASPYPRAREIAYILKTGANWSGPIQDFVLEVTPKANHLVAFCWDGKSVKPQANGKYIVKAKNLTPKQDLKILMLEPYDSVFGE